MEFALSTHLFHGERLTRTHLEAVRDAGFTDIEVFATRTHVDYSDERAVAALGDWLAGLGLAAGSMHAPIFASFTAGEWGRPYSNASPDRARRQEAVGETARALAACRALGSEYLVLHLGVPTEAPGAGSDNDRRAVQHSLEEIAELAAASGVRLALEVIPNPLSTPDALLDSLEGDLDLGQTGICLDVGHAHILGGAPEAVETLAGHILTTHVHDNRTVSDDHLVPFAGTIDWPATLTALWKVGYTGRLVFEVADHEGAGPVLERTVGARRRLQAILEGLSEPFDFQEP
jgi:sugar phosphate isomerase/epimerase